MKFKFKSDENTTLDDIKKLLDEIKSTNVKEIPLNYLRNIIIFLGGEEVPASRGSSVRFYHEILENHPYFHGFFQIHIIHKGGDQQLVKMHDYKKYLYNALKIIIELKK